MFFIGSESLVIYNSSDFVIIKIIICEKRKQKKPRKRLRVCACCVWYGIIWSYRFQKCIYLYEFFYGSFEGYCVKLYLKWIFFYYWWLWWSSISVNGKIESSRPKMFARWFFFRSSAHFCQHYFINKSITKQNIFVWIINQFQILFSSSSKDIINNDSIFAERISLCPIHTQ